MKVLVGIKTEIAEILQKYENEISVHDCKDGGELEAYLQENAKDALLIAATEESLHIGKRTGCAVVGYQRPGEGLLSAKMVIEGFEEVDLAFLERIYQRAHKIPWVIAETKRTIIREAGTEDLLELAKLYQDAEILKFVGGLLEPEEELEFQKAYIRHQYGFYGYGMWLVCEKNTQKVIGRAGLEHWDCDGEVCLELGYLIHKDYRRQGYATEVCEAILRFAAELTDFEWIHCRMDEENVPSRALAEKLGFEYVAGFVENGGKKLHFRRKNAFPKA